MIPQALAIAPPAVATKVTLAGSPMVPDGAIVPFVGHFELDRSEARIGIPLQDVRLILDDVFAANAMTGTKGDWRATTLMTGRGVHVLRAVAAQGTPQEARSPPLTVRVIIPPTPPGDLTAEHDGFARVSLAWSPPVDDGGSAITNYHVERPQGASWQTLATLPASARTFSTMVDREGEHTFRISASNILLRSEPTAIGLTIVLAAPDAPSDLTATPRATERKVDLAWTLPSSGSGPLVSSTAQRSEDGGFTWITLPTVASPTAMFVDSVASDGAYTYRVFASNPYKSGPPGVSVGALVAMLPPSSPASITAVARQNERTVDLAWDPPASNGSGPVTAYRLDRSVDGTTWTTRATLSPTTLTHADAVPADSGYAYRVAASNTYATGAASATWIIVDMLPPSPATNVQAAQPWNAGYIDVTWDAPADEGSGGLIGYDIERLDAVGWETHASTAPGTRTWRDTSPLEDTDTYRVRARNAYETATPSNSASLDFRIPDHIDHELVSVEVCTGINRSGCTAVQPGGTMTVAGDQWHLWIEIAGMLTIDEAPAPGIRVTTFTNITRPCGNGCTSTTIAQQLHDTGANGTYASHITWTRTQNGCESVLIRSAGHYAGFSSPTKVLGFTMCS